jgi:quercetin dioxygenase-like cupin family protein
VAGEVTSTKLDYGTDERFVSLRRALGVESFGINQLTLRPGERGRIHRHREQEEVYLVLEGTLTLELEGDALELGPGELARVPAQVRRRLQNGGDETVVLVALGGAGSHAGRDGEAFASWDDHEPKAPQDIPLPENLPR